MSSGDSRCGVRVCGGDDDAEVDSCRLPLSEEAEDEGNGDWRAWGSDVLPDTVPTPEAATGPVPAVSL